MSERAGEKMHSNVVILLLNHIAENKQLAR